VARFHSAVARDMGYERGYVRDYNRASLCPTLPASARAGLLWGTAISAGRLYVSLLSRGSQSSPQERRIVSFARP